MLRNTNIARGTTDPGIASITWIISPATKQANSLERKIQVKHSIGSNFGQMTLPALVLNLPTRWRHLKIQIEHSIGSNFGNFAILVESFLSGLKRDQTKDKILILLIFYLWNLDLCCLKFCLALKVLSQ